MNTFPLKPLTRPALALFIGGIGAGIFYVAGFPLPFLLGALAGTMIAGMAGAPIGISAGLRLYITVMIGLMVGGVFTPEVAADAPRWIPTLIAVVIMLAFISLAGYVYCRKVLKMDRLTALFSGLPGGLTEMIILGEEHGADLRKLILTHGVRVAVVLLCVPFFLVYGLGYEALPMERPPEAVIETVIWTLPDGLILLATAVSGYWGGKVIRLPAHALTGPMLVSAAVHLNGAIEGTRPELVTVFVQLAMGSALGSRFAGAAFRDVGRHLILSMGLAFLTLLITIAVAGAIAALAGLSFPTVMLAFAPGGFAEMALVALSLQIDPAFVTTHHGTRLLVIVFIVPVVVGVWLKTRRDQDSERK